MEIELRKEHTSLHEHLRKPHPLFITLPLLASLQVSHHPPMFAHFVEHKEWIFWQEWTMTISFRGKYVACYPVGCCHLVFHRSKSHYTWGRPTVIIHNIIVGQPWVDQVRGGANGGSRGWISLRGWTNGGAAMGGSGEGQGSHGWIR